MTIAEARASCKLLLERVPRDVLLVCVLLLATSAAFGLGILAGRNGVGQGSDVSISQIPETANAPANLPATIPAGGQVVASKSGTKYYLPWCSGASRISAANKVTFATPAAALAAGYTPASNCKGL